MKIVARIAVLLLNAALSLFFILWGLSGPGLADGVAERFYPALIVGLLLFPTLLILLVLGKSRKKLSNLFGT
jgi:hypothetical protein